MPKMKNKIFTKRWILPPIFMLSLSIFFWTLFDSILGYVVPIMMQEQDIPIETIGLIIGVSSVFGALFDFVIGNIFKNATFRRVFIAMFALCMVHPLVLWQAKTIWMFLIAMAIWGIYYDMYYFGVFNFIGHFTKKKDHATNFGIIQTFRSLGLVAAPIFAGSIIAKTIDWTVFFYSWVFLVIGVIFFVQLLTVMKKKTPAHHERLTTKRRRNPLIEIKLWKKLVRLMTPALFVTFYICVVNAFFWTLAPLFNDGTGTNHFNGLLLAAFSLPALFFSSFVGKITNRFGKKRTAIVGIFISSLFLASFVFFSDPIILIAIVFISSSFMSISSPAIDAVYADYMTESQNVDNEIEGIEDLLVNLGFVVGPISAGLLAGYFSISTSFSIIGLIGVLLALILFIISPDDGEIKITNKQIELL